MGYRLSFVIAILFMAFVSSYCIVRGVSLIVGGFPSELEVAADFYDDHIELDYSGSFIWYLCSLVVLTIISFCYQFNRVMKAPIETEYNNQFEDR